MKTKETYCELEMEVVTFEAEDLIASSGEAELPIITESASTEPQP